MALVAYDCSDCSDLEDENSQTNSCKESGEKELKHSTSELKNNLEPESSVNIFSALPKPSLQQVKEEDDEFLHKVENIKRQKAKINIPSLSDFKDVEDLPVKKKPFEGSGKKSGLLSMLPEPKFSASSNKPSKPLIPKVVERKIMKTNPCPPVQRPASISNSNKSTPKQGSSLLTADYSDSDEEDSEHKTDFFSIHTTHNLVTPEPDDVNDPQKIHGTIPSIHEQFTQAQEDIHVDNAAASLINDNEFSNDEVSEFNNSQANNPGQSTEVELDEEAIRRLCGSRNKHKKEEINMITVDQKQVLSDSREWLLKGLMDDTTKRVSASKRKGNEPTTQQRKKHQITYLAHQAKANEAELQNQWANNRMSKRQTQSKYGF